MLPAIEGMRDHRHQVRVNELIQRAMAAHGIETSIVEGWVGHASVGPAIQGHSKVQRHTDPALTVRLEVRVAVPDGRIITERFGAAGDDVDSATLSAFDDFSAKSLDAIVAAFFDETAEGPVFRDEWMLADEPWRITASRPAVEAWSDGGDDEPAIVPPPAALMPQIRRLVERRVTDAHDVHWVQIFFAHQGRARVAGEVSWDGVPWPEARETLAALPWPDHDGFHSVRCIVVAQRAVPTTPPVEDVRSIAALVRKTTELLASRPGASDSDRLEALTGAGLDASAAKRLLTFVPLGFAHFLFKDLPLPTESTVLNPRRHNEGRPAGP